MVPVTSILKIILFKSM